MIRAAAKNHADVTVVTDPSDYEGLLEALAGEQKGEAAVAFRKKLAWKAFLHCSAYDSKVSEWLWSQIGEPPKTKIMNSLMMSLLQSTFMNSVQV